MQPLNPRNRIAGHIPAAPDPNWRPPRFDDRFDEAPSRAQDYAPSRTRYRLQRYWLTPAIRHFVRFGVPLILLTIYGLSLAMDPNIHRNFQAKYEEIRQQIAFRPEFIVNQVEVRGASKILMERVLADLGLALPISSLDLDLNALRAQILDHGAVRKATLRLRGAGTLEVMLEERKAAMLWRQAGQLTLLGADGVAIGGLTQGQARPALPLIVGKGADAYVAEAVKIYQAAYAFEGRVRGLQRIGERRWNLVLDRDQIILLPEENPVDAVERLVGLHMASGLLERDITAVDLRNERVLVRVAEGSLALYREQRLIARGDKL